jgi:hypothetical protein
LIAPQWIDLEGLVKDLRNSTINLHAPNRTKYEKLQALTTFIHKERTLNTINDPRKIYRLGSKRENYKLSNYE